MHGIMIIKYKTIEMIGILDIKGDMREKDALRIQCAHTSEQWYAPLFRNIFRPHCRLGPHYICFVSSCSIMKLQKPLCNAIIAKDLVFTFVDGFPYFTVVPNVGDFENQGDKNAKF